MSIEMTGHRPCPWCGNADRLVCKTAGKDFYIYCGYCRAYGPDSASEPQAWDNWDSWGIEDAALPVKAMDMD